ncbi:WD repeat-containing protein on Y chromosome-like [Chanos chanos]|uniref:WD repeat-containing protein on Y chromosome n=1 Tax=Chanos chanos TaxID=29144 RepID=A0A6J2UU93_CHACN|nr:WD repeat-containing protein on Y chromosome-like [Chanos chanos]
MGASRSGNLHRGGSLDPEEFQIVMRKIMPEVKDQGLVKLFMQIDTNCDGTVDWDEFLNFLVLEQVAKHVMLTQSRTLYFPCPLKIVGAYYKIMAGLQFCPHIYGMKKKGAVEQGMADSTALMRGNYFSISQDGVLKYWTDNFELNHTANISLPCQASSPQKIFVVEMVCISNLDLLAIASTKPDIDFYETRTRNYNMVFSLSGLKGTVVAMDYWSDGTKGIFSIGDSNGYVTVFISWNVLENGLFNSRTSAVHKGWCEKVRFLSLLNAVASCSACEETALALTSIPNLNEIESKSKFCHSSFRFRKGLKCFDYSPELNIFAGGGRDCTVFTWDPHSFSPSCLRGHPTPISHIVINGQDNRVISVSVDKNVRVWDLHRHECVQNIPPRDIDLGRGPISIVCYNYYTKTLIMATHKFGLLSHDMDGQLHTKTSHEKGLCAALYNSNFQQVVSGCHKGVVKVWDIETGKKITQFQTSPEECVEVTAMSFDPPKRRLITGCYDGKIRLWNFNNGELLLTLPVTDPSEITGIQCIKHRIFVSGWSKRVVCYLDEKDGEMTRYSIWNQYHCEDIVTMHAYGDKMLATACRNGDINLWNMRTSQATACESGRISLRFNASESHRPQEPNQDSPHQTGIVQTEEKIPKPGPGRAEMEKRPKVAVTKVLFLGTREIGVDTATLLTSDLSGYIHAWSTLEQGGLLARFIGVHRENMAVTSMSTDQREEVLLTGDSCGFITLWDIENYCYCMHGVGKRPPQPEDRLHLASLIPSHFDQMKPKPRYAEIEGWKIYLTPPPILGIWRCHQSNIVSVEYVECYRLILTASLDFNVRLWTLTGSYIVPPEDLKKGDCRRTVEEKT